MNTTNREIIEKYYEFMNAQQFDKAAELVSENALIHGVDYVGLGIFLDSSSGNQVVVKQVYERGPSVGLLEVGDVITRVKTADQVLESFEDLTEHTWGLGKLGEQIDLTIKRDGELCDVSITRGRVPAQASSFQEALKNIGKFIENVQAKILISVVEGDKVAVYVTGSLHNKTYNLSTLITTCSIIRLENEKIVDWWGTDDDTNQLRQLGFQIIPPVKEKA